MIVKAPDRKIGFRIEIADDFSVLREYVTIESLIPMFDYLSTDLEKLKAVTPYAKQHLFSAYTWKVTSI